MKLHPTRAVAYPFARSRRFRHLQVDVEIAPVLEAIWALGIDTSGSCQGFPFIQDALIVFPQPAHWCDKDDVWEIAARELDERTKGWGEDAALEAIAAKYDDPPESSGALRLAVALDAVCPDSYHRRVWEWSWGGPDDPSPNPGSALLLPNEDLPRAGQLAQLAARVAAEPAGGRCSVLNIRGVICGRFEIDRRRGRSLLNTERVGVANRTESDANRTAGSDTQDNVLRLGSG